MIFWCISVLVYMNNKRFRTIKWVGKQITHVSLRYVCLVCLGVDLRPQTPKHIRGGWSLNTDTSEPVDGNGAQNMVQPGFWTSDLSITGPARLPTALTRPTRLSVVWKYVAIVFIGVYACSIVSARYLLCLWCIILRMLIRMQQMSPLFSYCQDVWMLFIALACIVASHLNKKYLFYACDNVIHNTSTR
jgi:hypothetical protein